MAPLELRPRSATEIVDAAFQMMRQNYTALLTLSVAAQLPALAMRLWMSIPTEPAQVMQWIQTGAAWSSLALLTALSFVGNNVVLVVASQLYIGEKIDARAAFVRASWRTLAILIPLWILSSIAIGFGFVFLIVPGVWLALRFIPLFTVSILEDGGWSRVLDRTWSLGRGHVGHMFLTVLLALLIYIGVAFVGGVVVGLLGALASLFRDSGVAAVLSTAVTAAIIPLFLMMQVILYYDLRIRFEGFDVEMMSRDLGAPAPSA